MVNKENVLRLAKAFATKEAAYELDVGYNQGPWRDKRKAYPGAEYGSDDYSGVEHHCGTVGCMAGWAVAIFDGLKAYKSMGMSGEIGNRAQELLGLDFAQRRQLFAADANPNYRDTAISTCTVAAVLKNLAETGQVDWIRADKEAREANGQS